MRLTIAAALLTLSGAPASAAYLVDFGNGDHMTVDSYWEDGDRMHLMRDGVELSVPRARIRHVQREEGGGRQARRARPVRESSFTASGVARRAPGAPAPGRAPSAARAAGALRGAEPGRADGASRPRVPSRTGKAPRGHAGARAPGALSGRYGQPTFAPAVTSPQSTSEMTFTGAGSAAPPLTWLASASPSEL